MKKAGIQETNGDDCSGKHDNGLWNHWSDLHAQVMDLADAGTSFSGAQCQEQSCDVGATPTRVEPWTGQLLVEYLMDVQEIQVVRGANGYLRFCLTRLISVVDVLSRGCIFLNMALVAKSVITSSAIIFHYPSLCRLLKNSDYDLYSSLQ